jgi:MFS family permease
MAGQQVPATFIDRLDRARIPGFIRDLWADPNAFRLLLVAAVSLAAAGLNPVATSPALPGIQSAIRAQPEINVLLILTTLVAAALLFLGGVLADTRGRRGLLLGALGVLVVVNAVDVVIGEGALYVVTRFVATAAAYAVLPFGLALVATAYHGLVRATAIGIVYAAYGGGSAVSPVLMTLLGPSGPTWPAFLAAALGAAVALRVAWHRAPDLTPVEPADRGYVVATAIW